MRKSGKKGRTKKHKVEYLRTKIWYYCLSYFVIRSDTYRFGVPEVGIPPVSYNRLIQGCASPQRLCQLVDGKYADPSSWKKYRNGDSAIETNRAKNAVQRAEAKWPGSSAIFDTPIWIILQGGTVGSDEIIDTLKKLGGEVKTVILVGGFSNFEKHGQNGNQNLNDLFDQLEGFPNFSVLQAIILLLAWADNLKNSDFWNAVCLFYRHMIPDFIDKGDIPFHEELFNAIDEVACYRDFPAANSVEISYKSWKEELPRLQEMQADRERIRMEIRERICRG